MTRNRGVLSRYIVQLVDTPALRGKSDLSGQIDSPTFINDKPTPWWGVYHLLSLESQRGDEAKNVYYLLTRLASSGLATAK